MKETTTVALQWVIQLLAKYNIPYQLSGGFAAKMYGSNRELNDIDLDIPNKYFDQILSEIYPYLTYGPQRYQDEKWDTYLITLNYCGQEIDISGADDIRITTKTRDKWIPIETQFSKCLKINCNGILINVINPHELIGYKKHLDGKHQQQDILATYKYIKHHSIERY